MRYTLENDYLKIVVSELGATLVSFIDKLTNTDLVLGFDSDEEYIKCGDYIGASVGRNANRIGSGRFELNGKQYQLSINNNMNQLHGGVNGFAYQMYKLESLSDDEIIFNIFSKDGEEGFPGNLNAKVSYKLDKNNLIFSYSGISDKDTIFNMTNHSYFNLGDENILNQYLHILTDKYSPTDEYALTLDEVKDVSGTAYDFKESKLIGPNILSLPTAIDNNYVFENMNDKKMIEYHNDKIELNVYSDLPDIHIYTSYFLKPIQGKYQKQYGRYSGICFEAQYYPNGINYSSYIKPILKANEEMKHYIKYEVKQYGI